MDLDKRHEERGLRAAVMAGDESAWTLLYERHFNGLYVYVRFGRNPGQAEELVQDCWTVAVRRIRSFDPERGGFGDWLRGIADRLLLNQRRLWARRRRLEPAAPAEQSGQSDAHRLEMAERLMLAMAALPEHYRTVLRAKYQEHRPVIEIAESLGQTPKAVESLLTRARSAFRDACARLDGR